MEAKPINIRWDSPQACYRVDKPAWGGGKVYEASDCEPLPAPPSDGGE